MFCLGVAYSKMMMIVLVVHCGQTEARETMQLLKELPADVWLKQELLLLAGGDVETQRK
jgi:hypothetical protein